MGFLRAHLKTRVLDLHSGFLFPQITNALVTVNRFLGNKSKQPLNKFIAVTSKRGLSYFGSLFTNSTLSRKIMGKLHFELRPFFNLTISPETIQSYIRNVSTGVKNVFLSFDQEWVKRWAQSAVPSVISKTTLSMGDSLVAILKDVDKVRSFVLRDEFFKNPLAFIRSIPNRLIIVLTRKFNELKPDLFAGFLAAEKGIKSKIQKARYYYIKYLQSAQNLVRRANSTLVQLDHYSMILKTLKENKWENYLSNYTNKIPFKLFKVDELVGNISKSENLENVLLKMTSETKKWLEDVKSMVDGKLVGITKKIDAGIENLEKSESQMRAMDGQVAKNMTQIVKDAEMLIRNASDTVISALEQTNAKLQPAKDLLLRDILTTINNLQANATMIQRIAMRYMTLMDDASIVIVVPKLSGRLESYLLKLTGKRAESKVCFYLLCACVSNLFSYFQL